MVCNHKLQYNMKLTKYNSWNNLIIPLNSNEFLTIDLLKNSLTLFFDKVMIDLSEDQYVLVILRLKYQDGSYASLTNLQKINKKSNSLPLSFFN